MVVVNGLGRPAQTLPTNPASVALGPLAREADVGTDGDAAIVLVSGAGLAVAVAGSDGRFGAPQQLAPATAGPPMVRVGRGGATIVAWTARAACASGECTVVQAALRPPRGAFGPAITLDEQPSGGALSLLNVDAGRALALAFSQTCARAERVSDVLLRPRNGPWRAPVRVSRCGE
jgi:hypothetical protein